MKTWDISVFSLLVCRRSPTLSPNRAIILNRLVVEDALVVEDRQYFLGKVLRLQSSLTIDPLPGPPRHRHLLPRDLPVIHHITITSPSHHQHFLGRCHASRAQGADSRPAQWLNLTLLHKGAEPRITPQHNFIWHKVSENEQTGFFH